MLSRAKPWALATGILMLALAPHTASARPLTVSAGSYIKEPMEALAAEFQRQNPGTKVEIIVGPRSDDELTQETLRRSITGESVADLIVGGSHVRLFAERDLAVALDSLLAARPASPLLHATPAVLDKGKVGDKTYGVAFGLSLPIVLFNSELVRKAGGDPQSLPKDWPGIHGLAKKINALGGPVVGGFMEADNTGALSLLYLLQSQGGRMMDAQETKLTIDTPQGQEALKVLQGFGEAGQARASMTRDQARQAFGAGTIGTFVTMSSTVPRMEAAAKGRFDVVSVPIPVVAEAGSLPTAGPIASILTKDPEQQKLAVSFLEFLVGPAGQFVMTRTSGYTPVNQPAIDQSAELKALLAQQPNAPTILSQLPVATAWYTPPGSHPARIADIVNDNLLEVVTLKTTPEKALQTMTKAITPLVSGK